jgi:hypothetical protein
VAVVAALAVTSVGAADAETRPEFVPYLDTTLSADPQLPQAQSVTGAHTIALAFVVARANGCVPSWDGSSPVRQSLYIQQIRQLRARGDTVRLSFGGAGGPDLSLACHHARDLARAYETSVAAYNARQVDFDIEGDAIRSHGAVGRMAVAIRMLERWAAVHHRGLRVSLTVPVNPTGLDSDGTNAVRQAARSGAHLDVVNIMAMDYGDDIAPPREKTMADYAIAAARMSEHQLRGLLHTAGPAWSRLGITPMLGVNDVTSEVFTLDDATRLATFAAQQGVAQLSFWSVGRDGPCPAPQSAAQATCSGIDQAPGAFSRIFATTKRS